MKGPTFQGEKSYHEEPWWGNSCVLSVLLPMHKKCLSKPPQKHPCTSSVEERHFSCCQMIAKSKIIFFFFFLSRFKHVLLLSWDIHSVPVSSASGSIATQKFCVRRYEFQLSPSPIVRQNNSNKHLGSHDKMKYCKISSLIFTLKTYYLSMSYIQVIPKSLCTLLNLFHFFNSLYI